MIDAYQLATYVIRPALQQIGLHSRSAVQLLLGTAAAETRLGHYVHQISGPALGIYQMEPATHDDIWLNYLSYRPQLADVISDMIPEDRSGNPAEMLLTDLRYATVMARVHYLRSPLPLPQEGDWAGMAAMWKSVYNTNLGAGTIEHFMSSLSKCKVEMT